MFDASSIQRSCELIKSIAGDPTFPDKENNEFVLKLYQAVEAISKFKDQASSNPSVIKDKVIHIFKELDQEVDKQSQFTSTKVKKIHEKLAKAQDIMMGKEKEKISGKKADVKLAFFCDLDAPDHNGAFGSELVNAFQSKIPFITTKSLLQMTEKDTLMPSIPLLFNIEKEILSHSSDWIIFQGNGFLLFLPKVMAGDKNEQELLAAMDFKADGTFKKIGLREVFSPPEQKPQIEDFFNLFSEDPQKTKLIYVAGHGGVGRPSGLTTENYKKFLHFLNQQNCQGLTAQSCYSGGESSLLHLPEKGSIKPEEPEKLQKELQRLPFPVVVHSIGDFPTRGGGVIPEINISSYFDKLEDFIISDKGATLTRFQKMMKSIEGSKDQREVNLMQVYFPHAADSPGGFRAVGEGGASFPLTFHALRSEEVLSERGISRGIVINNNKLLEVHPLAVTIPVIFQKENPVMLSMTPGAAQHYLQEVRLDQESLNEFLLKNEKFYKESKIGVEKAFIIGKVISGTKTWEQVVFVFNRTGMRAVYFKNGQYYQWNGRGKSEVISGFQYAKMLNSALDSTRPSEIAVRTHTGGQQSPDIVRQITQSEEFWGTRGNDIDKFIEVLDKKKIADLSPEKLLSLLKGTLRDLSIEDKESLVIDFVKENRGDLAKIMIENEHLSPSMKTKSGNPLLFAAITFQNMDLFKYLIEKGADINATGTLGKTVWHAAIGTNNREVVEFLLAMEKDKAKTFNTRDTLGMTPIFDNLKNFELFKLMKDNGADIHVISKDGASFGSLLCQANPDQIEQFFEEGLHPNLGSPLPLITAIKKNDSRMIEYLLKKGADPFQESPEYNLPVIEAMFRSPPRVVKMMLDHPNFENNKSVLLLVAIGTGNKEYIDFLLSKGAEVTTELGVDSQKIIEMGLKRFAAFEDFAIVKELLKRFPQLESAVVKLFIESHPKFIEELIREGLIKSPAIFNRCLSIAIGNFNKYLSILDLLLEKKIVDITKEDKSYIDPITLAINLNDNDMLQWLLERGADPSRGFPSIIHTGNLDLIQSVVKRHPKVLASSNQNLRTALDIPEEKKSKEIFKWLVLQGADINQEGGWGMLSPFCQVIEKGDYELFDFCLQNGAIINPEEKTSIPLILSIAAINKKDPRIFKKLVEMGANLNAFQHNYPFATPFAMVVGTGNVELIEWCLEHGADAEPRDSLQRLSPLMVAASIVGKLDKDGKNFKLLLAKGADVNQVYNGSTPFLAVLASGNLELVNYCMAHGAVIKEEIKTLAIVSAISSGKVEITKRLPEMGVDIPVDLVDNEDLLLQAYLENIEMFNDFLKLSQNPKVKSSGTAGKFWEKLISNNDVESFKKLVQFKNFIETNRGIILEKILETGNLLFLKEFAKYKIPIKLAEISDDCFERLVEKGNLNSLNFICQFVQPPLRQKIVQNFFNLGIQAGNAKVVELMLKSGANPDELVNGNYPVFAAIERGNVELLQVLIQGKADLRVKSNQAYEKEKSVLDKAKEYSFIKPEILKIVRKALRP